MSEAISALPEVNRQPHLVKYPSKITKAIFLVSDEANVLVKEHFNEKGGYEYVSIDQYYASISPILAKHGLRMVCNLVDTHVIMVDNNEIFDATVLVDLIYKDGTCIKSIIQFPMHHPYREEQGNASIVSYAKKTAFRNVFDIATKEGDSDQHGGGMGGKRRSTKDWRDAGGMDHPYAPGGNVPVVQPNPTQMAAQFSDAPPSQRLMEREPLRPQVRRQSSNSEDFELWLTKQVAGCQEVRQVTDLYKANKPTIERMRSDDLRRYDRIIKMLAKRKEEIKSSPPPDDGPPSGSEVPNFHEDAFDPRPTPPPEAYGRSFYGRAPVVTKSAVVAPTVAAPVLPPVIKPGVAMTKTNAPRPPPPPFPRQAPPPRGPNVVALFPPQPGAPKRKTRRAGAKRTG